MKILLIGFVSSVIVILSNISVYHVTEGQYYQNPSLYYVPIEFDAVNRGQWNISNCLKDLLNCWELTKADILCSYQKYKTTICGFWRDNCHDTYGRLDTTWGGEFTLFEGFCYSYSYQEWT